jgi:hypothetical protein
MYTAKQKTWLLAGGRMLATLTVFRAGSGSLRIEG